MYRLILVPLASALLVSSPASAQLMDDFAPPQAASCCLPNTAKNLAEQLQDWNQLGRYHAANEELKKQPADAKRVVFIGDSITDGWRLAASFPGTPSVYFGTSGPPPAQMTRG